jgi:predicted RNA-binding protein with TRAM domain
MASVKQRGKTYRITISLGFKSDGIIRIRKFTTFKPTIPKKGDKNGEC